MGEGGSLAQGPGQSLGASEDRCRSTSSARGSGPDPGPRVLEGPPGPPAKPPPPRPAAGAGRQGVLSGRAAHLAPGRRASAARRPGTFLLALSPPSPPARRPPPALPARRGPHFPAALRRQQARRCAARARSPRPGRRPCPRLRSEGEVRSEARPERERAEQAAQPAARAPARGGGAEAHPLSCLAAGRPGRRAPTPMAARVSGQRSRSARTRAPE